MADVGQKMIQKFRDKTGGTFSDPTLDDRITKEAQFRDYIKLFGQQLNQRLQASNYDINQVTTIDMGQNRPVFNGLYNKFHGLMITVNDTESTDIEFDQSDYQYLGNGKWVITVTITIHDHFGLDKHDALKFQGDHPALLHGGFYNIKEVMCHLKPYPEALGKFLYNNLKRPYVSEIKSHSIIFIDHRNKCMFTFSK